MLFKTGDKVRRKKEFQETEWWKHTEIGDKVVEVRDNQDTEEEESVSINVECFNGIYYHVDPKTLELANG